MSTGDSVGNGKYKGGESRTVLYICRKDMRYYNFFHTYEVEDQVLNG